MPTLLEIHELARREAEASLSQEALSKPLSEQPLKETSLLKVADAPSAKESDHPASAPEH